MQGEHNQMENNTLKCYLKFEFNLYQNESFEIYKIKYIINYYLSSGCGSMKLTLLASQNFYLIVL